MFIQREVLPLDESTETALVGSSVSSLSWLGQNDRSRGLRVLPGARARQLSQVEDLVYVVGRLCKAVGAESVSIPDQGGYAGPARSCLYIRPGATGGTDYSARQLTP